MTRPLTCGTTWTTYLITRTSAEDGATTFSDSMRAVIPTIGMITTVTCETVFHSSRPELDEDQPDDQRVDREDQDFHERIPSFGTIVPFLTFELRDTVP